MSTENPPDSADELETEPELEDGPPSEPFVPTDHPVRFSHLKQISRSPAHYLQSLKAGIQDTSGKRFGRGAHVLMLGGSVTIYPGERRGNKWKDFAKAHAGEEIVTKKEYEQAARLADVVRNHPIAGPLLLGKTEHHIAWEWMGRKCSSRVDSMNGILLTELKSTANAEPEWFKRNALKLGYHAQLAFYRMAAKYIGEPIEEVHIVAVEMKAPNPITVLRMTERALDDGEKLCRTWMERLFTCEAADEWPPYVQGIVPFDTLEGVELEFGDEEEAA